MEDKDFAERVLNVIKNNLFEFKKLFFNLDDCVSKKDFDDLQEKFSDAQNKTADLQKKNSDLEKEIDAKSEEILNAKQKISDLQSEITEYKKELQKKENELAAAEEKISALSKSLEEKNTEIQEKNDQLKQYAENYSDLETAYNSYKKLPDNTKFALEGIFGKGISPTEFLSGAIQEKNLDALFDYTATEINSGADKAEIEILCSLFEFAFSAINSGRREKLFERLETSAGAEFDGETMRKTSDSAQSGTIKNVLLAGYKYCRTGKVVKPSLVFIE